MKCQQNPQSIRAVGNLYSTLSLINQLGEELFPLEGMVKALRLVDCIEANIIKLVNDAGCCGSQSVINATGFQVRPDLTSSRSKYGCFRFDTNNERVLINFNSIAAIIEDKRNNGRVIFHLHSGSLIEADISYEEVVAGYLDFLGKERGTVSHPAGI